jgi:hypothetical protein
VELLKSEKGEREVGAHGRKRAAYTCEVFLLFVLWKRDTAMMQVPKETQKNDGLSEGHASLDQMPQAAERVDRHQYGDAVVLEDEDPVVGSEGEVGHANDRSVVLVLEDDRVVHSLGLPDINECIADLADVAARRRSPEWIAVIQIERTIEMYDEKGLVSREDRTRPVKGLDIE